MVTASFLLINGQRSLVGYSPWGCRESDMTEGLTQHNDWEIYSEKPKAYDQCMQKPHWLFPKRHHQPLGLQSIRINMAMQ